MRERLIELFMSNSCREKKCPEVQCDECPHIAIFEGDAEKIADLLLANGVIVPPCKVGTIVYVVRSKTSNGKNLYMREERIDHYRVFDERIFMCFERGEMSVADYMWEESVFLTREEAEQALKGGEE